MTRPSVDVIVPFHGSDEKLAEVVDRFRRLTLEEGDTLVIVDNRANATRPSPPIAAAPERQSSYYARNRGAGIGTADWLVFLDDDVVPPPDLIDQYFARPVDASVGVLGGGIEDVLAGSKTLAGRYALLEGSLSHENTMSDGWAYAQTANAAVRRAAFETVGGFVDDIRSGGDADLCFRIRRAGWSIEWRHDAVVEHLSRATVRALLRQHLRYGSGVAWLSTTHPGFAVPEPWGLRARRVVRSVPRAAIAAARGDTDHALLAALAPLTALAFRIGWLMSNNWDARGLNALRRDWRRRRAARLRAARGSDGSKPVVGHVVDEYLPTTETFIHTQLRFQSDARVFVFARRTANLDRFPIPASVVVPRMPPSLDAHAGSRLHSAYTQCFWKGHELQLSRAVRRRGCQLLHAHFGGEGFNTLRAARRLGVPLVTTFYGFDLALPRHEERWAQRYAELFESGSLFCVEGPAMADTLASLGAPRERIRVVPIGIDLEQFPFRPPPRESKLVVFQAARFTDKKGFDLSLRAFAVARSRLPDAELWLVGDGPLRGELEELAQTLGIADVVKFLGMVDHATYRELLAQAHVGVQPSRVAADGDTEGGAPTVLLEYQARGIPYVGTRHADLPFVTGNPDLLVEEEDVDGLADALARLAAASDAELLERATAGREHVRERHDATHVAKLLAAVYQEAVGQAARR